jgi:bifunctional DNase/RNase
MLAPGVADRTRRNPRTVLVEVKVQSLGLDPASNTPVVILQESTGERVLPIWIGPSEASAIAMQMAEMKVARPLTHDLLVSVIGGMGGALKKVIITRVEENTYFAEMIVRRNGETISLDARPSDSIAVALRMEAGIFADDELLNEVTLQVVEEESSTGIELGTTESQDSASGMRPDELKEHLRRLNPEDFGRFTP